MIYQVCGKHKLLLFICKFATFCLILHLISVSKTAIIRLKSFSILGSVGEPINPEAWLWYYKTIGNSKCSIVDTFWQTETGGHVITPLPGATPMKPGSAVSISHEKYFENVSSYAIFNDCAYFRHSHFSVLSQVCWMKMALKFRVLAKVIWYFRNLGLA